jgi:excisionase family DNA binding protein
MFSIEMKFTVAGRDVPLERFMTLFFRECMSETVKELLMHLESPPIPIQPVAASAPVPTPRAERRVVSIPEAALLLGLRPSTIRAWIRQRKISSVHLGRRVVIPVEAIDDLLLRHRVPAISTGSST